MAWNAISGIVPQFTASGEQANGYVIKFYAAGTTTPLAVATDDTGGTTATNFPLNTQGYATHSGSPIVPHVNADYKLVLYLNQTDADANDTGSAVYVVDNIQGASASAGSIGLTELFTIDSGKIIIGGTSANAQYALSGDVTMTNAGVVSVNSVQAGVIDATALASNAVTTAKITDANVTFAKLASAISTGMPQLLSSTTPTAAAYVDLALDTSTYRNFIIEVLNVSPATDAEFGAQFLHTTQTVAYTSTDYRNGWDGQASSSSSVGVNRIRFTGTDNMEATGTHTLSGEIKLLDLGSTTTPYGGDSRITFKPGTGALTFLYNRFVLNLDPTDTGTNPQVDGIRLGWTGSAFGDTNFDATGTIRVYGIV